MIGKYLVGAATAVQRRVSKRNRNKRQRVEARSVDEQGDDVRRFFQSFEPLFRKAEWWYGPLG